MSLGSRSPSLRSSGDGLRRSRRAILALGPATMLAAILPTSGCAHWTLVRYGEKPTPMAAGARGAADTVTIEAAFVRVPPEAAALEAAVWAAADELAVASEQRRTLGENGLRVGVVGTQMPPALARLIDDQAHRNPIEDAVAKATGDSNESPGEDTTDVTAQVQRFPVQTGRRCEIVASNRRDEMPVLGVDAEGRVAGATLRDALCQFALRATPGGDGVVRLELTPEIQHGPLKNKYVADDGSFTMQQARDCRILDRLRFEAQLAPGQILLVGASPQICGLGKSFFCEDETATPRRTLLALRVIQTHADDLFSPPPSAAPIATPARE